VSTAPPLSDSDPRRWPLYWFARLEVALERGDLAQAADAQRRLRRLGLRVEPLVPWEEVERARQVLASGTQAQEARR
jgi:hypothetical protein